MRWESSASTWRADPYTLISASYNSHMKFWVLAATTSMARSVGGDQFRELVDRRAVDHGRLHREDDLSKGILDVIDMDSYRVEKQPAVRVLLPDQDAEIGPVPTAGSGHRPEPELDTLSNILQDIQRPVRQHPLD